MEKPSHEAGPSAVHVNAVTRNLELEMLGRMIAIRRFEEEVKRLYRGGEITGAIHLYIGQEAVAVGACSCLRDDDYVTSTHRPHGHCIAKANDLKRAMAEMMGRVGGLSGGRGGSMHQFCKEKGFLGGNGIVAGGVAMATGAAFAARYRGTDQVCVCFFSEGAANEGVVYECLNIAALWKLPVIYLCENNRYAATTPVEKSTCTEDIAPRAEPFGIAWAVADGNDVLDVHRVVKSAVERARRGDGPSFIECKTYRAEPHCGILPDGRDIDELGAWKSPERDPIARFETRLITEKIVSREAIEGIRAQVERELAEAVEFARASPFPSPESLYDSSSVRQLP